MRTVQAARALLRARVRAVLAQMGSMQRGEFTVYLLVLNLVQLTGVREIRGVVYSLLMLPCSALFCSNMRCTYPVSPFISNRGVCEMCPRGFYCESGGIIACTRGTFNPDEGQSTAGSCQPCAKGKHGIENGAVRDFKVALADRPSDRVTNRTVSSLSLSYLIPSSLSPLQFRYCNRALPTCALPALKADGVVSSARRTCHRAFTVLRESSRKALPPTPRRHASGVVQDRTSPTKVPSAACCARQASMEPTLHPTNFPRLSRRPALRVPEEHTAWQRVLCRECQSRPPAQTSSFPLLAGALQSVLSLNTQHANVIITGTPRARPA